MIIEQFRMENPQKIPSFECKKCEYITNNKKDYNKHLLTPKHKNRTILNKEIPKIPYKFICKKCEKKYKARNSLWYHEQKCNQVMDVKKEEKETDKELIMLLVKQNTELLEVIKNGTHNTTNNNNSFNKTFNLQIFLNETCKNAMNINEFIENIKVQLHDLIKVGEIGYIEGISNIITSNLQALDVTQRPIHCTDKKREVLYVKEDDKWDKENEEKTKVRNLIKTVANKNIKLISQFKEKYPDCKESNSKFSEQYNNLLIESMGGSGENTIEKEDNIIKNISKNITI
jgi:hypothetical protein